MSRRSVGVLPRVAATAAVAVAALGVAAVPAGAWGGWSGSSGGTTLTPFTQPLKIPPVLQPSRTDATTDYYNVNIQSGTANIIPGKTTPVWTYNGSFPGPTIVANQGRPVSVHVTNQLGEAMSTHLHGGHTPSIFDGLPNDLVAFGASKDYLYGGPGFDRAQYDPVDVKSLIEATIA